MEISWARKWTKKPKSHSEIIAVKVKSIKILKIFVDFFWLGMFNSHYSTKPYISHGFLTWKYILHPKIGVFRCCLVLLCHILFILLYKYIYWTYRKVPYCLILKFNIFRTKNMTTSCKKQMKVERLMYKNVLKSHFSHFQNLLGGYPLKTPRWKLKADQENS